MTRRGLQTKGGFANQRKNKLASAKQEMRPVVKAS